MAQLRQRRAERPARHRAARRQCQAIVQPHTLAWRSCGYRGIDNAQPPGPFACASPRRQVDEKAAAAAALGRGAAIFLAGRTHSHAWHRVAVPACPASVCRAAKGGRARAPRPKCSSSSCSARNAGRLPGPAPATARSTLSGLLMAANAARMRWRGEAGGPVQWECRDTREISHKLVFFLLSCDLQLRAEAACAPPPRATEQHAASAKP